MASRRWLLVLLSVASLVLLAWAGILLAFSAPISDAAAAESLLPGQEEPAAGHRAVVVPIVTPSEVPVFNATQETFLGVRGALLVVAEDDSDFPAGARNASVVRALVYVPAGAPNGSFADLAGLPVKEGDNATTYNATFDLAALSGGQAGFLVKPDATRDARFVPAHQVVGQVVRFESVGDLVTLFLLGGIGFVMPLVVLVLTHRPSGRPGVGDVLCAECRRPMPGGSDFCPGCGAWKKGKGA